MADLRAVVVFLALAGFVPAGCGGGNGGASQAATAQAAANPALPVSGVFALMDPGEAGASLDSYAALGTVDGLAFRALWRQLEPQNGNRDWSSLDTALDIARSRGKKLTVHIGVSGGAWPQWLLAAGMATYNYNTPFGAGSDPVPWDPVLLTRYGQLVSALAAHLQARGDLSLVRAVSDGAPVGEMSLVACQGGMLGGVAYSRATYLQAWQSTANSLAGAFPGTTIFISAPVFTICRPDTDGRAFYTDLMNYAQTLNGRFAVFAADLNASGSARLGQVDTSLLQRMPVGLQTIWSASNDPQNRMAGTLREAVCRGLATGARYFEFYKADLSSTDAAVQDAIRLAREGRTC